MARTDFNIPSLGNKFVDIREIIPGDSFNWSWVRPLSQVNYLAIHHTAGPDTQTPTEIANYHINNNGWGGIGYHFLISKDGIVYYVGDISTARANVANLNDQVIGICLIGNFTQGREPQSAQLDSANKLCDFFINNYPLLSNLDSWDKVRGHKDLPGQSTVCPGDSWQNWRPRLITAASSVPIPPTPTPPLPISGGDRGAQITESYRLVLGRDPDMGGLQTYTNGPLTLDQIIRSMVESEEHKSLIRLAKEAAALKSQVGNLQTSLASVNQQLISLQENLQAREEEIAQLKKTLAERPIFTPPPGIPTDIPHEKLDNTLTIVGSLINLYKFVFPPGKETPT